MTPRITRALVVLTALAVPVLLATARIQGSTIFDAILTLTASVMFSHMTERP
jgi:hypothetical protein